MVTLDEMRDEAFGPVGTPRRDRVDRNTARWLRALDTAEAVTRHWPAYMRTFWVHPIVDKSLSPFGFLDVMSFSYLGDFLFYGQPVTADYAESWMAKVHLPWRRRP